jgi:uncharacterized membrane protein
MNAVVRLLLVALLALAIDIPWLLLVSNWASSMVQRIQRGVPMTVLLWPAVLVYLAIAYLLVSVTTDKNAFFVGAATYAIYDFTNLSTLGKYEVPLAIADTLWGGTVFWLTRKAAKALRIL